jgi:hypothetical protein
MPVQQHFIVRLRHWVLHDAAGASAGSGMSLIRATLFFGNDEPGSAFNEPASGAELLWLRPRFPLIAHGNSFLIRSTLRSCLVKALVAYTFAFPRTLLDNYNDTVYLVCLLLVFYI